MHALIKHEMRVGFSTGPARIARLRGGRGNKMTHECAWQVSSLTIATDAKRDQIPALALVPS